MRASFGAVGPVKHPPPTTLTSWSPATPSSFRINSLEGSLMIEVEGVGVYRGLSASFDGWTPKFLFVPTMQPETW